MNNLTTYLVVEGQKLLYRGGEGPNRVEAEATVVSVEHLPLNVCHFAQIQLRLDKITLKGDEVVGHHFNPSIGEHGVMEEAPMEDGYMGAWGDGVTADPTEIDFVV